MRISIVTPSLNQCGFIPEMLASLGSQDYPDWEHVVFDAGSTDGSVEVWREWEERGKLRNGEMEKWGNEEIEKLGNREAGCVVPMHHELRTGTLHGILKQAGISREEFIKAMR